MCELFEKDDVFPQSDTACLVGRLLSVSPVFMFRVMMLEEAQQWS